MAKIRTLWPYDYDDMTTWKYLDCVLVRCNKNNQYVRHWILNPNFKYKHLDPKYPKYIIEQEAQNDRK